MTEVKHLGLPVHGYRAQNSAAVDAVNENKRLEELVLRRFDQLASAYHLGVDQRWYAIARTHIEEGFMALNRAVFKPERVSLPEQTKYDLS